MIDFKKTAVAKVANPRKEESEEEKGPGGPKYRIKINHEKEKITISKSLFEELNLANNSISHGTHPDMPGELLFIVCPGDTGTSFKSTEGAKKGQSKKYSKLIKDLLKLGKKSDKFNLEKLGTDEGLDYYKMVEYFAPVKVKKGEAVAQPEGTQETATSEAEASAEVSAETQAEEAKAAPSPAGKSSFAEDEAI